MNWYFQYARRHVRTSTIAHPYLIDSEVAGPPQAHHPFGAQRLRLYDGPPQRPDRQRQGLHGQHQLDQGHRPEDRPAARLTPAGHPDLFRHRQPHPERAGQKVVRRSSAATITGRRATARTILYVPALPVATTSSSTPKCARRPRAGTAARIRPPAPRSNLTAIDPITGDIKKNVLRYPSVSGTLATGGGLIFLGLTDGTVAEYDDVTLAELWKTNVDRLQRPADDLRGQRPQYLAIATGLYATGKRTLVKSPELKDQRNATVLYVFGL